jgi:hypothetical protein
VILGLHLTGALLQTKAQVSAHCRDLLKQGAHVLGVACGKCLTRMVGRKFGVADGGHVLTPHHVALVLNGEQDNRVSPKTGRWRSRNSMRAWWAALSRVSSRSSPRAVVNQAVMVGSVG